MTRVWSPTGTWCGRSLADIYLRYKTAGVGFRVVIAVPVRCWPTP